MRSLLITSIGTTILDVLSGTKIISAGEPKDGSDQTEFEASLFWFHIVGRISTKSGKELLLSFSSAFLKSTYTSALCISWTALGK